MFGTVASILKTMPKKVNTEEPALVKTAPAAVEGAGSRQAKPAKPKVPKLVKHTKSRLPRKEKKAQKKAASRGK